MWNNSDFSSAQSNFSLPFSSSASSCSNSCFSSSHFPSSPHSSLIENALRMSCLEKCNDRRNLRGTFSSSPFPLSAVSPSSVPSSAIYEGSPASFAHSVFHSSAAFDAFSSASCPANFPSFCPQAPRDDAKMYMDNVSKKRISSSPTQIEQEHSAYLNNGEVRPSKRLKTFSLPSSFSSCFSSSSSSSSSSPTDFYNSSSLPSFSVKNVCPPTPLPADLQTSCMDLMEDTMYVDAPSSFPPPAVKEACALSTEKTDSLKNAFAIIPYEGESDILLNEEICSLWKDKNAPINNCVVPEHVREALQNELIEKKRNGFFFGHLLPTSSASSSGAHTNNLFPFSLNSLKNKVIDGKLFFALREKKAAGKKKDGGAEEDEIEEEEMEEEYSEQKMENENSIWNNEYANDDSPDMCVRKNNSNQYYYDETNTKEEELEEEVNFERASTTEGTEEECVPPVLSSFFPPPSSTFSASYDLNIQRSNKRKKNEKQIKINESGNANEKEEENDDMMEVDDSGSFFTAKRQRI